MGRLRRGNRTKEEWLLGVVALCLCCLGSVLVLAGFSGPSPAGLPPAAAYQVGIGNEELYPLAETGLLFALLGTLLSIRTWQTLGGKIGGGVLLAASLWIVVHHGRA